MRQRHLLSEGFKAGVTALEGLIAYGRGEAFDYLIGEQTSGPAMEAIRASGALLMEAENPVVSVNGNTAVLCPYELVRLAGIIEAKLEVNLFYRTDERVRKIEGILRDNGAGEVYGIKPDAEIEGLEGERRLVDSRGIYSSDVVLVALEDGDRTQALVDAGKAVVAIDLNPLSRTARTATITIVDNVVRAVPILASMAAELKDRGKEELRSIIDCFSNKKNLDDSLRVILEGFKPQDWLPQG